MSGLGAPLSGQTVLGRVVEAEAGTALQGVFLSVTDSTGQIAAGALSREGGTFILRAPHSGPYVLRLELIGYRTVSETVRLQAGETVHRVFTLPLRPIELDEVVGTAEKGRCEVRPSEAPALVEVWEAARQGLRLAQWSAEAGWVRATGYRYQRVLDLADEEVLAETIERHASIEPRAFSAVDPETVRTEGFVVKSGDGDVTYRGADAALVLSDEFLDTHCFRLSRRTDAERIGLEFEPVRGRAVPEISGVLWLDAETGRLSLLEYDYTRYPVPAVLPVGRYGGRTQFRYLPGGALGVVQWRIRMPTLLSNADVAVLQRPRRCGRHACEDLETLRVLARAGLAIEEEGGVVLSYRLPDGTPLPAADRAAIAGGVVDSTASGPSGPTVPLVGARVYALGTDHEAVTDERGRFRLEHLSGGRYRLLFHHPKLAQLGLERPGAVVVDATEGAVSRTTLALPSKETLALGRCRKLDAGIPAEDAETGAVWGVVSDAHTGATVGGATVQVRPVTPAGGEATEAADTMTFRTETDAAGRYTFCSVHAGRAEVRAHFLGIGEQAAPVVVRPGRPTSVDLPLVLSTAGRLVGRVVDEDTGEPVIGALVRVTESGRQTVTDETGRFVFDATSPGLLTVTAEHLAYARASGTVTLRGAEAVSLEIRMAEQALELDPIVVTARSRPLMAEPRMGGFHIRRARGLGTFLTAEELADRPAGPLTRVITEATPAFRSYSTSVRREIYSRRNEHCYPQVYLNGTRILSDELDTEDAVRMLDAIPVSQVAGVEIYPGASSVPGEFAGLGTQCGVIAVWTQARDRRR